MGPVTRITLLAAAAWVVVIIGVAALSWLAVGIAL